MNFHDILYLLILVHVCVHVYLLVSANATTTHQTTYHPPSPKKYPNKKTAWKNLILPKSSLPKIMQPERNFFKKMIWLKRKLVAKYPTKKNSKKRSDLTEKKSDKKCSHLKEECRKNTQPKITAWKKSDFTKQKSDKKVPNWKEHWQKNTQPKRTAWRNIRCYRKEVWQKNFWPKGISMEKYPTKKNSMKKIRSYQKEVWW